MADDFGATPIDVARDWQRLDILDMLAGMEETGLSFVLKVNEQTYWLTAYRSTTFLEANRERVELVANGLSNQVDLPPGIQDIITAYLC